MTNKTVNKKVQARVENLAAMGYVGEALDPSFWQEWMISFLPLQKLIAIYYVFKMVKFVNINDGSGSVAANENDDNA